MQLKKNKLPKEKYSAYAYELYIGKRWKPKSVYLFAKLNDFTEQNFILSLEDWKYWERNLQDVIFQKTIELLHKDKDYPQYDKQIVEFYYILRTYCNRSYVILSFKHSNQLKNLKQLTKLKHL
jgi:hypothetical protein